MLEIINVVEKLAQVGILHLFCFFDFVEFENAVAPFHKIDTDGVVDGDIFFVLTVSVFMEHFTDIDIIMFVLKCDVMGKKPELGVADVKIVDLDTCYFHCRWGGWWEVGG